MTQPPESTDSSAPNSTKRANDMFSACCVLSSDGAAAVLAYACTMIDKNRRFPPTLQNVPTWKFVGIVNVAAEQIREVYYVNERRRRREFVFIASVYRHLFARGDASAMSLAAFKARVLEARMSRMMMLERCRKTRGISPLLIEASTVQGRRGHQYHLIERDSMASVKHALEHVTSLLPNSAYAAVASFARRVHADEALRDGRPRLITLEPEKFAARIQEFVDRNYEDMPITTLFWKLEDRGEMTGINFDSFRARLFTAHRAGRLQLGTQSEAIRPEAFFMQVMTIRDVETPWSVVRRSNVLPPIPWGPPHPPIIRRLVLHAP